MRSITTRLCAATLVLALSFATGWAQLTTAQINGTARDQSGAVLPGVEITAMQTATGLVRTAVTNETGTYTLPNLPIGPYRLEASLPGFRTYVRTGIVLEINSNPVINVALEIGQVAETIEVQANAALVETRATGVGQIIDNQRVLELPLNGRMANELIFLTGMATPGSGATNTTTRNYPTISVNVAGGLATGIGYTLDGGTLQDPYNGLNLPMPFPDALQEFKVETSALPAQYGHYSSAAVNAITKSGTNQFHGNLFEFVRNKVFNARNAFSLTRDPMKRNQFGGTIGGPIIRDKLFFFGGFQGTLQRSNPATQFGYVPTPAMMAGDFTAFASTACRTRAVTLGAPFVNNRVNPALFSPAALKMQALLPKTDHPCGEVRYASNFGLVYDEGLIPVRVDYQFSDKQSVFARYQHSRRTQPSDFDGVNALTVNSGGSPLRVNSFVLGHTYLIGNHTVSNFRGTINRSNIVKTPQEFVSLKDLGVKAYTYHDYVWFTVSQSFTVGTNQGTYSHYNTTAFQFADDLSTVKGSHQLGFGASWIQQHLNAKATVRSVSPVTFDGQVTGLPLADFLLGRPSVFSQGTDGLMYARLNLLGIYLQDSWQAAPGFTVNAGIRWEPYLPTYLKYPNSYFNFFDRALFDQGVKSRVFPKAPAGLRFPGDEGMPDGARVGFSRMGDFAPRVGIAWDPFGDGRTSVRGAYGIFYNRPNLTTFGGFMSAPPQGNFVEHRLPQSLDDPWANFPGGDPFPIAVTKDLEFPLYGSYFNFPLDAKATYQNQWNLSIQREVASDWLASATYVGSNVIHMWSKGYANPAVFIPGGSTAGNTNQRRVLYLANPAEGKYYGDIQELDSGGTGFYHGLLLGLERRSASGFTTRSNYTWSHCIGDVLSSAQTGERYTIPYRRSSSRGDCGSDRRHVFNSSLVFRTPELAGATAKALLGGWQISGIVRLQSGEPLNIGAGSGDRALTGAASQRANQLLPNAYAPNKSVQQYLNPDAFATPPLGTYGNMGYNAIRGPGRITIDMALTRRFQIRENQTFEFRAEAFNLPNHMNPGNPSTALTGSTFGQIRSAADPRIVQFAVKYVF